MGKVATFICSTVLCLICYFAMLGLWLGFLTVQLVGSPQNIPNAISIPLGSDFSMDHLGESCHSIEVDSLDPTNKFTVYLIAVGDSVAVRKSVGNILVNHTLEVGNNSDQLTYYGVPVVARGDEVRLYVRAVDQASAPQSVDISVYDLDGFTQLNANSAANPESNYNFDRNCLLSPTGCVVSPTVESEGWFYFVFESEPSPSTLLVSLDATVRKYDVDNSIVTGQCDLAVDSKHCEFLTPKDKYKIKYQSITEYLPFTLTYQTHTPIPTQFPPLQSLNTSSSLTWTCISEETVNYTIIAIVFGIVFGCMSIVGVVVVVMYCCDRHFSSSDRVACLKCKFFSHIHSSMDTKEMQPPEYSHLESPPSYDNATKNNV